ncbi:MAG: hypothetical protein QOJ64_4362 [Acidobacteriota bacterium]|jgi:predicted nuclease with TOPRIM domain|nr:hypothetical protein [Acidobacteriota bacterium]
MSENSTGNLHRNGSFEERVLAELAGIRQDTSQTNVRLTAVENRMDSIENGMTSLQKRMDSLEEKVDARMRETRPIWENVQQRLTEIESALSVLNRQFRTLIHDSFNLRSRVEKLEDSLPAA